MLNQTTKVDTDGKKAHNLQCTQETKLKEQLKTSLAVQ